MLIVFLDPGLNKMYSLSTAYLTIGSRCHTHRVFMPRSFFMEGKKVELSAKLHGALLFQRLSKSLFKQVAEFHGMNQTTNASS